MTGDCHQSAIGTRWVAISTPGAFAVLDYGAGGFGVSAADTMLDEHVDLRRPGIDGAPAARAPAISLQQETAATNPRSGSSGCAYSRSARPERHLTTRVPPLCKQGVRGSSPLGSTVSQRHFRYPNTLPGARVKQQSTATVPASGDAQWRSNRLPRALDAAALR